MDTTIKDFFDELEDITPAPKKEENTKTEWRECSDKLTGYKYYWNTKTDEVSWDRPGSLVSKNEPKPKNVCLDKREGLPFTPLPKPPGGIDVKDVKIYSIQDEVSKLSRLKNDSIQKEFNKSSQSTSTEIMVNRRMECQEGAVISKNVTKISNTPQKDPKTGHKTERLVSLVAGYSDSEEEDNDEEQNQPENIKLSLYTNNTKETKSEKPRVSLDSTLTVDCKTYQRKRKLDVPVLNIRKPEPTLLEHKELGYAEHKGLGYGEHKGLGFGEDPHVNGVMRPKIESVKFVKSTTLEPSHYDRDQTSTLPPEPKENKTDNIEKKYVEDLYNGLHEKLSFLCEGREQILPVQVMLIQAETLFQAMKDECLDVAYLKKWVHSTLSELVTLEKEAAPSGWNLQWDKLQKRYYYQNQTTGECQWEYPQIETVKNDDSMDISTTPPPPPALEHEPRIALVECRPPSPPLPPVIRNPTPPPPPIISVANSEVQDILLPLPPVVSTNITDCGQPLPPGVDVLDTVSGTEQQESSSTNCEALKSELNSFYSEIASESTNPKPEPKPEHEEVKKVKKIKIASGLSLKKKGVSELVKKWKNVQQNYKT